MTASGNNRRRKYIINPKFQWRYLRTILVLEVIVFAVAALVTLALNHLVLSPAIESGSHWNSLLCYLIALFLGLAAMLFWLGIRISNRISGPLYRVCQVLGEVREGRLPDVCRIRTGDCHPEVAEALCEALGALRRHRLNEEVAWREQAEHLRLLADEVGGDGGGAAANALRAAAADADERADQLVVD